MKKERENVAILRCLSSQDLQFLAMDVAKLPRLLLRVVLNVSLKIVVGVRRKKTEGRRCGHQSMQLNPRTKVSNNNSFRHHDALQTLPPLFPLFSYTLSLDTSL
jgi:hypothetical protein